MDYNYTYILISILSYLIGAVPFAFILVKLFHKKDITLEGSGNSGAMNGYEVTNNKAIGVIIFVLDFLKAYTLLSVLSQYFDDVMILRLAASFVVLGHNYSIFIRFNGGRGLSPAAGAISFFNIYGVLMWLLMFFTSKKIFSSNVHISTAIGLFGANIMLWASPEEMLRIFEIYHVQDLSDFRTLYILISIFIISKLIKPMREFVNEDENIENPKIES